MYFLNTVHALCSRYFNEILTEENPFVITPLRLNYAIFGLYQSGINTVPFESETGRELSFEDSELQVQCYFNPRLKVLWT
ncbi:MAG: hypothetical protein ISEC1_P0340 [Thiomicrorhabdus sp.]|nr:MAG: hypothetical protein ISEC1_P0340 [Thiomicrorhabdus sp.]